MKIISIQENPEYENEAIQYFQESWTETAPIIYQDCLSNCTNAEIIGFPVSFATIPVIGMVLS